MMFKQKLNVVNENYCGIFKWRNHNVQKSTLKFNKNLKKKLQEHGSTPTKKNLLYHRNKNKICILAKKKPINVL